MTFRCPRRKDPVSTTSRPVGREVVCFYRAVSVGTQWESRGKNAWRGLGTKGFAQKKVLSLVLCVAMLLSVMVMGTGAASFTDEDEFSPQYAEAAEVLTGMGVIQGYDDGSFLPQRNITRAQVATMIYRAVTHDVTDSQTDLYKDYNKFEDVPSTDWSAGYVGYCANGELIKGFTPTTFGPNKNVTGYQVLAMILRAIGYDQNDEFTGSGWEIRTATTAQQLGILENVQEATLGQPATRELVAELIFQAMSKPYMVDYTPALGYQPVWPRETLGQDEFGLKLTENTADVWGRPSDTWHYNTGDKETVIEQAAAHTYTTAVSECDIANDLGLTKTTALEKAYIDGESQTLTSSDVTTNRYASINPLATTSYVGAQGRVTEVYDMGDAGLRLVEINTYLAQVDKVTAATTDKNGHTTDATVDLQVFSGNPGANPTTYDMNGVVATGFSVGDYVLVQISNPGKDNAKVQSIKAAPLTVGGKVTSWTNASGDTAATTTVGDKTYNEANKFYLNYRDTKDNWMVATDDYGNVIGLVPATVNYLVVEKIEWKHSSNTVGGGYALADVVLADGTDAANVTIATINDKAASNAGDSYGNVTNGTVSDSLENNGSYKTNPDTFHDGYYNHIFTYSVNSDGSYNIAEHNQTTIADVSAGTITNGVATISSQTNTYVATNTTVFLLKNADRYTYTTYVGKDAVPSITNAKLCILTDGNGYATLVVANNYALATNTFLAYVTDNDQDVFNNANGAGYYVYKLGETTATTVYAKNSSDWKYNNTHETGLYTFTVNAQNQITNMQAAVCDLHCNGQYVYDNQIQRAAVKAGVQDGSFQTEGYTSVTLDATNDNGYKVTASGTVKDFNVTDATTYIVVTKNALTGSDATLAAGTAADVTAGSVVLVDYTTSGNKLTADTVYILRIADDGTNPDPTEKKLALNVSKNSFTATYNNGDTTDNTSKVYVKYFYKPADQKAYNLFVTTGTVTVQNGSYIFNAQTITSNTDVVYNVYAVAYDGNTNAELATSPVYTIYS